MKFLETSELIGESSFDEADNLFYFGGCDREADSEKSTENEIDGVETVAQAYSLNIQNITSSFDKIVNQLKKTQKAWKVEKARNKRRQKNIIQLQKKVEVLESEQRTSCKTIGDLNLQIEELTKKLECSLKENKNLKNEIHQRNWQQNTFKADEARFRKQMGHLQRMVSELNLQVTSAKHQKRESEKSYKTLLESYFSLQSERIQLSMGSQSQQREIDDLHRKNQRLERDRQKLQEQILATKDTSSSDHKTHDLQNQVDQLQKKCQDFKSEKVNLEANQRIQLEKLKNAIHLQEILNKQLQKAEHQIEILQNSKSNASETLKGQLAELKTQNNILKNRRSDEGEQINKRQEADRIIENLHFIISEKNNHIKKLERQAATVDQKMQDEKRCLEKKTQELLEFQVSEGRLRSETESLLQVNKELSRQVVDLEKKFGQKDLIFLTLQKEIEHLRSSISLLETQIIEQKFHEVGFGRIEKDSQLHFETRLDDQKIQDQSHQKIEASNEKLSRLLSAKDHKIGILNNQINRLNRKMAESVRSFDELKSNNNEMALHLEKVAKERNQLANQIKASKASN